MLGNPSGRAAWRGPAAQVAIAAGSYPGAEYVPPVQYPLAAKSVKVRGERPEFLKATPQPKHSFPRIISAVSPLFGRPVRPLAACNSIPKKRLKPRQNQGFRPLNRESIPTTGGTFNP